MYHSLVSSIFILSASAAVLPRQQDGQGCPHGMKSVTFNSGYDVNQFDTIGAAEH